MLNHIREIKKQYFDLFRVQFPDETESKDFKFFDLYFKEDENNLFSINPDRFQEAFELSLEAYYLNKRNDKRNSKKDSVFKQLTDQIRSYVHFSPECQQNLAENKSKFRSEIGGMIIENISNSNPTTNQNSIFVMNEETSKIKIFVDAEGHKIETIIQKTFIQEGVFKITISNFGTELESPESINNPNLIDRKIEVWPPTYDYDNYLSMSDLTNSMGIKKILETFETNNWEYLNSLNYKRQNASLTLLTDCYLVVRVLLNKNEIKSRNLASVKVEYMIEGGEIKSILADFIRATDVLIFSNQVLILFGQFASEKNFKVKTVCNSLANYIKYQPRENSDHHTNQINSFKNSGRAGFLVIKGPFINEHLDYINSDNRGQINTIVNNIKNICRDHKVAVLIIIGPIISQTYNISECQTSADELQTLFLHGISGLPHVKTFMISDYDEITNIHPIPIKEMKGLAPQVYATPNPVVLDFDGFKIGFSNTDLLNELNEQSITTEFTNYTAHLKNCLKNLVTSGSLHPIHGLARDYELSHAYKFSISVWPDVFVFNSDSLPEFIEKIDAYLFINLHSFLGLREDKYSRHNKNKDIKTFTPSFGSYCFISYDASKCETGATNYTEPKIGIFNFNADPNNLIP